MIVDGIRDELAAVARTLPVVELTGRCYAYPPDVAVAPAVFVADPSLAVGSQPGTFTLELEVVVVTDAAAHAAGRWLDQTAELLLVAYLAAGYRPRGWAPRVVELDVDDRDDRPGRVLAVPVTFRPCP